MSLFNIPSTSPNIKLEIRTQPYEELSADFYDQFLTFDCDVDDKYANISPSTYLDNASTGLSISTLSTESSEYRRPSMQHLPLTTPTTQSQMYNEMMERAAINECEIYEQENGGKLTYSTSPQAYGSLEAAVDSKETTGLFPFAHKLQGTEEDLTVSDRHVNFPGTFDDAEIFGHKTQQTSAPRMHDAKILSGFRNYRNLTPPMTCKISDISPDYFRSQRQNHTYPDMSPSQSYPPVPYPTPYGTPSMSLASRSGSRHASLSPIMVASPKNQMISASFGQTGSSPPRMNHRASSSYPELDDTLFWDDLRVPHHAQGTPNLCHPNPQRATKALALQIQNDTPFVTKNIALNYRGVDNNAGLMIDMPHRLMSRSFPSGSLPRQYASAHQRVRRTHTTLPYHPGQTRRLQPEHVYDQQQQQAARRVRHEQQQIQRRHRLQQPTSDTDSSCSKSPGMRIRKKRSPKAKRKASMAKSSSVSENGGVEFMNYTPMDSMKILTGVAPSGSSKTKARREQEALDRRMRLSEAALRAVRAAGGDVECLMDEGLFV